METTLKHLIARGREAFERKDYAAALADFREVLDGHPEFADIRHLAGLCHSFLGQPEAALEEFERAVALNDSYIEAHLNRAITLQELGRYDEAQVSFERAGHYETGMAKFPAAPSAKLANAHAAVGDLYMELGAAAEAAHEYQTAIALRPKFVDIRTKYAQALMQLTQNEEAEAQLKQALEVNPRFLPARLNLGLLYYRRQDFKQAAREWEECRAQQPNNPQVQAFLSLLERSAAPHTARK